MLNIITRWNSTRTALTISVDGGAVYKIEAGYRPNFYEVHDYSPVTFSHLKQGTEKYLYIRAVELDGRDEVLETETFVSIALPLPVLGLIKTCDASDREIVDILKKGSERWATGQRVVKVGVFKANFYVGDELYHSEKICAGQLMDEPPTPPDTEEGKFAYWAEEV